MSFYVQAVSTNNVSTVFTNFGCLIGSDDTSAVSDSVMTNNRINFTIANINNS